MNKPYIMPKLTGLQIGDLVKYVNPFKNIKAGRESSLGIIYGIHTESNSSFCYERQAVVSNDYTVYDVFWQQDIPGYPNTSFETEKYLSLVWSNAKQNELASQIGLYECETVVAGSIHYKYGDGK